MTHRPALPAPRTARRQPIRMRRAIPGIAVVGAVAIVGSLLTAPTPAHASEVALDGARAAISASMSRGTYIDDLRSGKITVEQIVEVDLAVGSSAAATSTAPAPSREELTRRATEEVAGLRAGASPTIPPEPSASTGAPAATDPLVESKHWWDKLLHWGTLKIDSYALSLSAVSAGAVLGVLVGGCTSIGAYVCAAIAAMGSLTALGMGAKAIQCLKDRHDFFYLAVPDFKNSHCGD
jgi:hypothetical protein